MSNYKVSIVNGGNFGLGNKLFTPGKEYIVDEETAAILETKVLKFSATKGNDVRIVTEPRFKIEKVEGVVSTRTRSNGKGAGKATKGKGDLASGDLQNAQPSED